MRDRQAVQPKSLEKPTTGAKANGAPKGESESGMSDVSELRRRARERLSDGAVTSDYGADREAVVRLLNAALATEIVCVLRYKRHVFTAKGIHAEPVIAEFREHAAEEQEHADRIAERIVQLGGDPDLSPEGLAARAHSQYDDSTDLLTMIREDLVAERVAIESYGEMIRFVGDGDRTTRRMLEEILASEEEHADDLATLLSSLSKCS
jgi:bacterioferritin